MIIKSFDPWVYKGNFNEFISPPFDTINEDEEAELKKNVDNITHITLPKDYEDAGKILNSLISSGKLKRMGNSIIIATIEYEKDEIKFKIPGIISLIDSSDPRIITHEKTFKKFVDDRMNLMRSINGQPEPVFVVTIENFDNVINEILENDSADKLYEFNFRGTNIKIYRVSNEETIEELKGKFNLMHGIIADGHHRLSASKALYDATGDIFWKYVMAFTVSLHNEGLKISGVNRIVRSFSKFEELEECIFQNFSISKKSNHSENNIEIYNGNFLEIKPKINGRGLIEDLPVSLINDLIFKKCMKWGEREMSDNVYYTNSWREVVENVDSGKYSFGILMPPFNKDKFMEIALKGLVFPQKSTYFNPKIPSGIALNLNL